MCADNTEKASIEEIYQVAGNTSDLGLDTRDGAPRCAADVFIAAGWTESRIGMALLRLHSEYDASEKPPRPTKASILSLVGTFQRALPNEPRPRHEPLTSAQAHHFAMAWHQHEMAMLLGKLKALPAVREQITIQALRWRMDDAAGKASAAIRFWLDQTCPVCHGLKWQLVPGSPALSNKPCRPCGGNGLAHAPHGSEGKRLVNYLDDCVSRARQSLKKRLRPTPDM